MKSTPFLKIGKKKKTHPAFEVKQTDAKVYFTIILKPRHVGFVFKNSAAAEIASVSQPIWS